MIIHNEENFSTGGYAMAFREKMSKYKNSGITTLKLNNAIIGLRLYYYDIYSGVEIYRDFATDGFKCDKATMVEIKQNLDSYKSESLVEIKGTPYQEGNMIITPPSTFTTQYELDNNVSVAEATPEEIKYYVPLVVGIMKKVKGANKH